MDGRWIVVGDGGGRGLAHAVAVALSASRAAERRGGEVIGPVPDSELGMGLEEGPVATVVHVPSRRQPEPVAAAAVVEAAGAARGPAPRCVLVGSSEIYEPSHHHPCLIDEARLSLRADSNPVSRRWAEVEESAVAAATGKVELVRLRPAPVPLPCGDEWVSDLLGGRWAATLPGRDPTLQLLALPDLAEGVRCAVERVGVGGGVYNLVPAEVVPLHWALRLAGARRLPVPAWLQRVAGRPRNEPRQRLAYLAHPWTAAGDAALEDLGFRPRHTSAEAAAALAGGGDPGPLGAGSRRSAPGRGRSALEALSSGVDEGVPGADEGAGAEASAGGSDEEGTALTPPRVDLSFDDFGMSPGYIAAFGRTLFRFLHDAYWRVEQRGVERVPRQGRAVLVGVHRGFQPWDGVMALHLLRREVGRIPRFLIHPCLVKFPFLGNYMRRLGGVPACAENAHRILGREGLLAVFPEGIRGAFTPYDRAYRLGNFGRRDHVRFALAHGAPLVPFVTVGSAEIYPILGRVDWRWLKRLTEWPYLPLTPTFPWPPFVPLPSKWHTRFLEPVDLDGHGPESADDPEVVREIGECLEERMQAAIDDMLRRRRSWWRGSVFD